MLIHNVEEAKNTKKYKILSIKQRHSRVQAPILLKLNKFSENYIIQKTFGGTGGKNSKESAKALTQ